MLRISIYERKVQICHCMYNQSLKYQIKKQIRSNFNIKFFSKFYKRYHYIKLSKRNQDNNRLKQKDMNQGSSMDRLNLDKLVDSQSNYEANINETISIIQKDKNIQNALKKLILFCKYVLSVNGAQKKKFLCLKLIKDISQNFKTDFFEKILDEHIPAKLMKTITGQIVAKQPTQSRNLQEEEQYSQRLVNFAIQTVCFWARKLTHFTIKSNFSEIFQQIKKLKLNIPKNFEYYKMEKILNGIFGQKEQNQEEFIKNEQMTPLLSELHDKFNDCKNVITQRLNIALQNQQELYLKDILQKIRDFLLLFFSRYKALQEQNSIDRDVLIVYFHIMNSLFKKIANRIYIPTYQMISMTKEIFQGTHSSDFASIDRMDIANLAGIHKYNALSIFQRIHQRIQQEEKKLGVCQVTIQQQQVRDRQRQKQRDKQILKKNSQNSRQKLQLKSRVTERNSQIDDKKFSRTAKNAINQRR